MKKSLLIITIAIIFFHIALQEDNKFHYSNKTTRSSFGIVGRKNFGFVNGPLFVSSDNPRYFTDRSGKVIYLTGLHTWDNGQNLGTNTFNYSGYLSELEKYNHNFIRYWAWEQPKGITTWPEPAQPDATLTPEIFQRTGPGIATDGGLEFDVTKFNQAYFDRLRQRVMEARNKGIYVSIMLFNGWSVELKSLGANPWTYHPFNKDNNNNGIDGDPNNDQSGAETHTLQIPEVTQIQEAYVRKVIDTVNDLDNVLYEISNESSDSSHDWQYHMINFIKGYEATMSKQHPVGMTVEWPSGNNMDLFNSPADWISPNGEGGYGEDPPVADGSKVVILDTDHIWGIGGDRDWAWKSFTRGYNVIYMDPWEGEFIPVEANEDLRTNLGYILSFARRMDLSTITPQLDLCSSTYCLANPSWNNAKILIYLPKGRTTTKILEVLGMQSKDHKRISSFYLPLDNIVTVDLSFTSQKLEVEWFNPENGNFVIGESITGGSIESFTAPFSGDAVLYIFSDDTLPPTSTNTITPISSAPTQLQISTMPIVTQTFSPNTLPWLTPSSQTPISPDPEQPNAPLSCTQGFLVLSGITFLVIVWSKSFVNRK